MILLFQKDKLNSLATIRALPNLQIAFWEDYFFVKGFTEKADTDPIIAALPVEKVFFLKEQNLLFEKGKSTPTQELPNLQWQFLTQALPIEMPVAALPGKTPQPLFIRLIPSQKPEKGTLLKTDLKTWQQFAETTLEVRLQRLQFAVSENGNVLIWGTPLPPIPGEEFWENKHSFLPCGWEFEHSILGDLVQQKWNMERDAVLIFDKEGEWQRIEKENFVKGSRSGIRLTEV